MACAEKYISPMIPGESYHVYNRTNNKEKMFIGVNDRYFFIQQYFFFLYPFLKTNAYCLPDTHFHFVVDVRSQEDIIGYLQSIDPKILTLKEKYLLNNPMEELWVNHLIESEFHRFFTSYATNFNNYYERKGNLFHRSFKRVEIEDDDQFSQAILYVHNNPVKHGIVKSLEEYKWSSYQELLSEQPSKLERDFVLGWFGGKEMFKECHRKYSDPSTKFPFQIED